MTEASMTPISPRSPGQLLAEAREARGWSVHELALRLKFAPRQLQALEADAYGALPGVAIVRGMVRSYAKAVGLDPKPLMTALDERLGGDNLTMSVADMRVPIKEKKSGSMLYIVLSLAVAVALGAVVIEWAMRTRTKTPAEAQSEVETPADAADPFETPDVAPPAAVHSAATPDAPAAAPSAPAPQPSSVAETKAEPVEPAPAAKPVRPAPAPRTPAAASQRAESAVDAADEDSAALSSNAGSLKRLYLEFGDESWVEVRDAQGRLLMAHLAQPGATHTLGGKPPFSVVIGNASSASLRYGDREIDLRPYTHGEVARLKVE